MFGIAKPSTATNDAPRSHPLPRRDAARIPRGSAKPNATSSAAMASVAVGSATSPIKEDTSRSCRNETPKLPSSTSPMKRAYWTKNGASRCSRSRSSARASSLACSPRIASTGSPGTMRTIAKTSVTTPPTVRIARPKRHAMYRVRTKATLSG